jgi:dTDP-4-amino-4,6-dideoxygalactose transaminase
VRTYDTTRRAEYEAAIARVMDHGRFILGPEVAAFEDEWARFTDSKGAVGVASGTDALSLVLRAIGIGAGSTVLTVSHTATATVAAIELVGASPLLVDVDDSFTMDPQKLDDTLKSVRPDAIVPVHLYGRPAAMRDILAVAGDIPVIEDAAQAHGAGVSPRGRAAIYSFYPTKNLAAFGDAGSVTSDDPDLLERVRMLREYGWHERFVADSPGMNSRMDTIQAAVLLVGLRYLAADNERRRVIASHYERRLGNVVRCPKRTSGHVFHQYVIRTTKRDAILARATSPLSVHYPVPVHLQPAYVGRLRQGRGGLQQTELLAREILSLPMHAHLTDPEIDGACDELISLVAHGESPS